MELSELQEKLDRQSGWRKKEISQAYRLAVNPDNNDEEKKYLCRMWVLILYAHCDNFLKESSKLYIEFLLSNKNKHYDPTLIWLAIRGKDALTNGSESNYKTYDNFLKADPYDFLDDKLLNDTFNKSSFKYTFLRFVCDWVLQIQFKHNEMDAFCKQIKNKRDAIAHGEECYIQTMEEPNDFHKKTVNFIEGLKDELMRNAQKVSDSPATCITLRS